MAELTERDGEAIAASAIACYQRKHAEQIEQLRARTAQLEQESGEFKVSLEIYRAECERLAAENAGLREALYSVRQMSPVDWSSQDLRRPVLAEVDRVLAAARGAK
ncbi:MAG TPA: hypothetical protein VEC57_20880 [Candidatus Limnocylindrales bacterium]|nr:hypothetical protein [Candidatus Limnocylindrales bacterium]